MKKLALLLSHLIVLAIGFALGIYLLPVLIAPVAPSLDEMKAANDGVLYTGHFRRDLKDSDFLHWGEGNVSVGSKNVVLVGKLAPGPDYKLYLSPTFVETEIEFKQLKSKMVRIGDVRTFENFVVAIPPGIDVSSYSAIVVWCESFGQFITAARYQ